jgi:hypothetical protein
MMVMVMVVVMKTFRRKYGANMPDLGVLLVMMVMK